MTEFAQPHEALSFFAASRARLDAYRADAAGRVLVVAGPAGAGKSTLVRSVWPSEERITLDCFPGVFAAELIDELALAFMARGDQRLRDAVVQDAPFGAQLEILAELLGTTKACIVLEDVDHAEGAFLGASAGQKRALGELAARLRAYAERGGRVVVSVEDAALLPEPLAAASRIDVVVPELAPGEAATLWRAAGGAGAAPAFTRPIALTLAAAASLRSDPIAHADFAALCLHAWCHLPPDARLLLSALAHAGGRVTRGLLRAIARESNLPPHTADDLAAWNLIEAGPDATNRIAVNPAVARAVQDMVSRRSDDCIPNWTLLGDYWAETGRRARSVWDSIRGLGMYFTANNLQAAYELEREVIEQLLRRGALDLAEEILGKTIAQAQGRMRAVVLGNLAIVKKNQGDYAGARSLYEDAWRQFNELGDRHNVARVLHQLGNTLYLQGDLDTALRHYEESRVIAAECDDVGVGTAAQIQIANIHFVRGNMDDAARHYQQGLAGAERVGDKRMLCAVLLQLGHIHVVRERPLEANEALERADRLAQELGDTATRARALQLRGVAAKGRGDIERAAAYLEETIVLAKGLRDQALEGASHFHLGQMQLERGDLVPALKHLATATHVLSELGLKEANAAWELVKELSAHIGQERFRQLAFQAGVPWVIVEDATDDDERL
jgi:tetratricopeptide (TPR) repeat protein